MILAEASSLRDDRVRLGSMLAEIWSGSTDRRRTRDPQQSGPYAARADGPHRVILLDTNVISEPMRPDPDPHVIAWFDAQNVDTLHLSAVTVGELRYGVAALSAGRRRSHLHRTAQTAHTARVR